MEPDNLDGIERDQAELYDVLAALAALGATWALRGADLEMPVTRDGLAVHSPALVAGLPRFTIDLDGDGDMVATLEDETVIKLWDAAHLDVFGLLAADFTLTPKGAGGPGPDPDPATVPGRASTWATA